MQESMEATKYIKNIEMFLCITAMSDVQRPTATIMPSVLQSMELLLCVVVTTMFQ